MLPDGLNEEEYSIPLDQLEVIECDNMDNMEEFKDKFEGHQVFYW